MKTALSAKNPFGLNRHGFLWEMLRQNPGGRHLDYGAHGGGVIRGLVESGVVKSAVGVDLNADVVRRHADEMPSGATLKSIVKGQPLPFEDASFDSASLLDVLEHIYDQKAVLREIRRVLKPDGRFVVTVPGKNVFSSLDTGNFKFRFPGVHRMVYSAVKSKEEYRRRYIECENGLFGDVEVEKMWHQHFERGELARLLDEVGFEAVVFDGAGLFDRFLVLGVLPSAPIRRFMLRLRNWDAARFERTNLFCLARPVTRAD